MELIREFFKRWQHSNFGARVCKTRKISDHFYQCRVRKPNPNYCEHSICSGDGFICNSPERERFTQR